MTINSSVLSLANRSLLQIGARTTIASLDEGSVAANAVSLLWQPTYEQIARTAYWNCLRNQATLTLIAAAAGTPENPDGTLLPTPPTPWLYSYQTPSDNLAIRYLVPSQINGTPTGQIPLTTVSNLGPLYLSGSYQIPFAVGFAKDAQGGPIEIVLTNLSLAQAVYTVNSPNPVIFDSLFEQAFVSTLAAFLAPPLSLNASLMKLAIATAEQAIMQARVRDGDEGSNTQDHVPDWMRARVSGGNAYGWYGGGCSPSVYSSICWPVM